MVSSSSETQGTFLQQPCLPPAHALCPVMCVSFPDHSELPLGDGLYLVHFPYPRVHNISWFIVEPHDTFARLNLMLWVSEYVSLHAQSMILHV